MKHIVLIALLSLTNVVLAASPNPGCIAAVDDQIKAAANTASAGGYAGSYSDIKNRMTIAMYKGSCYSESDRSKLCKIVLDAMVDAGRSAVAQGGGKLSDGWLLEEAHTISGC